MEKRKSRAAKSDKVNIRGAEFYPAQLKAQSIDESTIKGIIDHLDEVGEVARARIKSGKCVESLVRESHLPRLEGILRTQLKKYTDAWPIDIDTELETTSDFLHLKDFFLNQDENSRPVFLFDLLSDVVWLSESPDLIDSEKLERLLLNLRALSFLTISQNNASTQRDQRPFNQFMRHIWVERCACNHKISAANFWNRAVSFIESKGSDIEFKLDALGPTYAANLLRTTSGKDIIEVSCINRGKKPQKTKKSFATFKDEWVAMRSAFINSKK